VAPPVSVGPGTDYERRGLWLALVVGLVVVLRLGSPGFSIYGGQKLQVWLYIASSAALGLSLLLCLMLLVPDLRARLGPRFREERMVFSWAVGLFVLGLLITIAAGIEGAIDSLDEDTPFG
jgi:hypothetical protein